jgi:hypothetical protein
MPTRRHLGTLFLCVATLAGVMHQEAWAGSAPTTLSFKIVRRRIEGDSRYASLGGARRLSRIDQGDHPTRSPDRPAERAEDAQGDNSVWSRRTDRKPSVSSRGARAWSGGCARGVAVPGLSGDRQGRPGNGCQQVFFAQRCTDLASRLSESIDATLALGDAPERAALRLWDRVSARQSRLHRKYLHHPIDRAANSHLRATEAPGDAVVR